MHRKTCSSFEIKNLIVIWVKHFIATLGVLTLLRDKNLQERGENGLKKLSLCWVSASLLTSAIVVFFYSLIKKIFRVKIIFIHNYNIVSIKIM